jgi:hypothetical protein
VPPPVAPAASSAQSLVTLDSMFWDAIKLSQNPADYKAYLRRFPKGMFVELAQNHLAILEQIARGLVNRQPIGYLLVGDGRSRSKAMATGYKTPGSGRKKGTPNKRKARDVKQLAEELVQKKLALQQGQVDAALKEQTPLEFLLEYMRDLSNPSNDVAVWSSVGALQRWHEGRCDVRVLPSEPTGACFAKCVTAKKAAQH